MKKPELPLFDVSRSGFPDSSTKAYVLSMSMLHQHLTERDESPSGKVVILVRSSGCAGRWAFTECVVDDHIIADQDVERFLSASGRYVHSDDIALGVG